jgi:hypothetical protein
MRRTSRLLNAATDEVGWISTTDMFVVACCLLLFLAVTSKRRTNELEGQLGLVTEQLELSKAPPPSDAAVKLETMAGDRKKLLAELENLKEQIVSISDQRLSEITSSSEEKQLLFAKARRLEDELNLSEGEVSKLKDQLESAREAAVLSREQAISQQRSINNKLVGLGGKLENVVFMVDVSKSMQSGKGPDGVVLNNWVPIVEVIERWINSLNVRSAALIVFGDSADVKVEMQELNQGGRKKILEVLKQIDPNADGTNFLAAFEKAYRIPKVDTIIVFSDGLPSIDVNGNRIFVGGKKSGESDEAYKERVAKAITDNVNRVLAVHRRILEMAKQHPSVAVNVIGLGAGVYNEKTGNLLNDLALNNGGVFLALPSRALEDDSNVE